MAIEGNRLQEQKSCLRRRPSPQRISTSNLLIALIYLSCLFQISHSTQEIASIIRNDNQNQNQPQAQIISSVSLSNSNSNTNQISSQIPSNSNPQSKSNKPDSPPDEAIDQLTNMLGLRHSQDANESKPVVPEFMLELYKAVADERNGFTKAAAPFGADTVIGLGETGESHGSYFWFDVSSINLNDTLLEAELHLYRLAPRFHRGQETLKNSEYIFLHVLQLLEPAGEANASIIATEGASTVIPSLEHPTPNPAVSDSRSSLANTGERETAERVKLLRVHRVNAQAVGWEAIPVMEAVTTWVANPSNNFGLYVLACDENGHALEASALRIEHGDGPVAIQSENGEDFARSSESKNTAAPKRTRKPSLIVFSESEQHRLKAQEAAALTKKPASYNTLKDQYVSTNERRVLALYNHEFAIDHAIQLLNEENRNRFFASPSPQPLYNSSQSQSSYSFSRLISRFKRNVHSSSTSNGLNQPPGAGNAIPAGNANATRRVGLANGQSVGSRARYQRFGAGANGAASGNGAGRSRPCSKYPMRVDFKRIGWSNWIISPQGFDALRCAGECGFPIARHLNPTNHAIIQAILHALQEDQLQKQGGQGVGVLGQGQGQGQGSGANGQGIAVRTPQRPIIPGPCCVPEKYQSISLLYFDENGDAVLKNYDNMIAVTCACR